MKARKRRLSIIFFVLVSMAGTLSVFISRSEAIAQLKALEVVQLLALGMVFGALIFLGIQMFGARKEV